MLRVLAPIAHRKVLTSVVAEGKRAQAAALVRTTRLDLLISGDAAGRDSLPLVETVARLPTPPAVLVIAERITEEDARTLLARGAAGVLLHRSAPQHLAWALTAVAEGSRALSPEIADAIVRGHPAPVLACEGALERVAGLSSREREVLALLGEGLPNRAIAQALHISPETVKNHVRTLCVKLRATSRIHAARIAWQAGVTALPA
ncbi:response regulator transcription factor [Streptomyces actuosus]|uniref:Response regulator transcription factor n=1 Tax=Streptomyces actuosus TaxID=1885 RepID=A0ABS2VTK4_STRAS|nr:response regulator transcription factor [Streptomyces actuosus]MBN0046427.1 response regulator transcription factor [Streptomyces actuosus]